MGYYRGSKIMGERFLDEALKRKDEVDTDTVEPYVKVLLEKLPSMKRYQDTQKIAEDALMYSTLFQNAALKKV